MPEFADCLAGFVRALDLDRPHVLGHSWGSSLALELYRRHPELVASLVLVGAYAGWAGSLPPDEVARRLAFALELAKLPAGGFEPTTMPGLFSDQMPAEQAVELAGIMRSIRPAGTRSMAFALAEADQRDMLPAVVVPTLLVYGDADERSRLEVAASLRRSDSRCETRGPARPRSHVLPRSAGQVRREGPPLPRFDRGGAVIGFDFMPAVEQHGIRNRCMKGVADLSRSRSPCSTSRPWPRARARRRRSPTRSTSPGTSSGSATTASGSPSTTTCRASPARRRPCCSRTSPPARPTCASARAA